MTNNHRKRPQTVRSKRRPTNIRLFLALATLALLIIIFVFTSNYILDHQDSQELVTDDDKATAWLTDLELAAQPFEGESFPLGQIFGQKPIWGTLNSGHYFGLKLSSPQSIETSLLWFENQLNSDYQLNIRHLCDQNDRLDFYSWVRHDFHTFGEQEIEDHGYRLVTTFVKPTNDSLEFEARISVEFLQDNMKPLSLIQYINTNRASDKIKLEQFNARPDEFDNVVSLSGFSEDVGEFSFEIDLNSQAKNLVHSSYHMGTIDQNRFTLSGYLMTQMHLVRKNNTQLIVLHENGRMSSKDESPNIFALQLIFSGPSSIKIKFKKNDQVQIDYTKLLTKQSQMFDEKFARLFPLEELVSKNVSRGKLVDQLSKVALSNMIGSVGYFYGLSFIGNAINPSNVAPYGPIQLLTGVPSRSFFPRGFLWDEGFHNILISKWDPSLSNKIIISWFDLMNQNGWIPREVILGLESMRRVPREFLVQRITDANPPAMFIAIEKMLDEDTLEQTSFEKIYPKLKAWYIWFNTTQFGPTKTSFRWRGRDKFSVSMLNPKTLASGLDDYPRASHPSSFEYHVDLRCWMALASRTLAKFADRIGDQEFSNKIREEAHLLADNKLLDELHWSEDHKMYCDFGHNTDEAQLIKMTKTRHSSDGNLETYQVIERHSTSQPKFGCVPEFGYVSLFPMLFNIIDPGSEKLNITLERLRDPDELWSPYGIRSLSKSSKYYNKYNTEHDKPYWRGAVWLNLNYLILSSLKYYSTLSGPYQDKCANLFIELKENIVNNVLDEFAKSRYIWENYDDQTGQARGSHPFTGWSSLILLIMSTNQ